MKVVVVESPAKCKTIERILGEGWKLVASRGHIIDIPNTADGSIGVTIRGNKVNIDFEPLKDKKGYDKVAVLKKAIQGASEVWLATDSDREGEAIAWAIDKYCVQGSAPVRRVIFDSITPKEIKKGISNPREIDGNRVKSQFARRALDRIIGYRVSPVMWKFILGVITSAGRVQSPTLALIVDIETKIENFTPIKYFTIEAFLKEKTRARFDPGKGKLLQSVELAKKIEEEAKQGLLVVLQDSKDGQVPPPPPFKTSTLQQVANSALKFSSKKCMRVAQTLYEGIAIDGDHKALITYMRTDSERLSEDGVQLGESLLKESHPHLFSGYKGGKQGAQDAHPAIHPCYPIKPEQLKGKIGEDELALYTLIYYRFIASFAKPAIVRTNMVGLKTQPSNFPFVAIGKQVVSRGWWEICPWIEREDVEIDAFEDKENAVPAKVQINQEETKPPSRYTEGTLIKKMETIGIGRPATWAPTLEGLKDKGYIVTDEKGKYLKPTQVGKTVILWLKKNYPTILDYEYTSRMESRLDKVDSGEEQWESLVIETNNGIDEVIGHAEFEPVNLGPEDCTCPKCKSKNVRIVSVKKGTLRCDDCGAFCDETTPTDITCPFCGVEKLMQKTSKKFGIMYICTSPKEICGKAIFGTPTEQVCPLCGKMVIKKISKEKKVEFLSCVGFPDCKWSSFPDRTPDEATEYACPECNKPVVLKTAKSGKKFYSCSGYPECKWSHSPEDPQEGVCPKCKVDGQLTKHEGKFGPYLKCGACGANINGKVVGACTQCSGLLMERMSKKGKPYIQCSACNEFVNTEKKGKGKYKPRKQKDEEERE